VVASFIGGGNWRTRIKVTDKLYHILMFLKIPNLHEGPHPVADPDFLHRGSHARI
jgi:hypothetical protein